MAGSREIGVYSVMLHDGERGCQLVLDRESEVRFKLAGYRAYEDLEEIVKPLPGAKS